GGRDLGYALLCGAARRGGAGGWRRTTIAALEKGIFLRRGRLAGTGLPTEDRRDLGDARTGHVRHRRARPSFRRMPASARLSLRRDGVRRDGADRPGFGRGASFRGWPPRRGRLHLDPAPGLPAAAPALA